MVAIVAAATPFVYVEEKEAFLALFPHRYDFIYAAHPDPKEKPNWRSDDRYPLSDRQLLKGEYLYGVRFEKETQYFLLDIDRSSPYHPAIAPLAFNRIFEVLEPLGLSNSIICTSSDSEGLHVYIPISRAFNSWKLAKAVSMALEAVGFKLKLGQLEIFPNPKAYVTESTPSLFNAHRLPLQMGSYILNDDLQPVSSSQTHFARMWQACQRRNQLNTRRVKMWLRKAKQFSYNLSNNASKYLSDLNTEIENGWTGQGQTNRLLGRIAMRSFVFNHVVEGGNPLAGKALIEKIVSVAIVLPGYKDWCQHQHEIEDRATEWARCIENSHYFAYGSGKGKYRPLDTSNQIDNEPDYNQKKSRETREKIKTAFTDLKSKNLLPEAVTARFKALLAYKIGGASLYRYRELWHPIELEKSCEESELQPATLESACAEGANAPQNLTSLLPENDSNSPDDKGLDNPDNADSSTEGSNTSESPQAVRDRIRQQLAKAQEARRKNTESAADNQVDEVAKAIRRRSLERMREFLLSGEPILLVEVGQWLVKQTKALRREFIAQRDPTLQSLISDLATVAECLVQIKLSPWEVRFELEERFEKSTILDLTRAERKAWARSLVDRVRTRGSA